MPEGHDSIGLDAIDRALINALQDGVPVRADPYAPIAAELAISEDAVVARLERLLAEGFLSRLGPMYHAERLGGGLTLAAIAVPEDRYEAVSDIVNGFDEVAHNYARDHQLNMWFVLATEEPGEIDATCRRIEVATGLPVLSFPKTREFALRLRFQV